MRTRHLILPISSLFFAIAFLAIGYGMILTYVGLYLKDLGACNTTIGIINAAFFLGAIASSIFSQKIISNVGHIRSFATFAAIMVITFLIHALIFDPFLWGILRFFSGFAYYGMLIILESWLNEKSPMSHRGKILAFYSIIFYLSISSGQFALNIELDFEYMFFIIGSVLVLFSVIFISMTRIKEPVIKPFNRHSFPKLYEIVPLALTSSFIGGFLVGGFLTMFPIFIIDYFGSIEVVSIFMGATILGGLVANWPIGILSDRLGRRKLIAASGFYTAAVSLLFLITLPLFKEAIYLLGFLLGMGIFCLYSLSLARANDVLDTRKDVVEISRSLLFTYGLGSFIAPLIIGLSMNLFSG
ncbi:MAG: MFS transporter, partial [Campylobacterota bacterium]